MFLSDLFSRKRKACLRSSTNLFHITELESMFISQILSLRTYPNETPGKRAEKINYILNEIN